MKKSICYIVLLFGFTINAQWDGTYNTKFGVVKLVQEAGNSYNNFEQTVYGDYGQNGTMIGKVLDRGREIRGTFHNGSQSGSFIWRKVGVENPINIKNIAGYWGYGTQTNDYSNNEDHKWNGEQTISIRPNDLNNAIWSGRWNTNFGELMFEQVGTIVTGKYYYNSKVSNIDANYNKFSKILVGSYVENGKTVYFQFNLNEDANSYVGKWGMTSVMNDPRPWNGTKAIKSNAVARNNAANSNNSTVSQNIINNNTQSQTNNSGKTKLTVSFDRIKTDLGTDAFYGIWGIKVFRLTNNTRTIVSSFGNKSDMVYNQTRNSSRVIIADDTNLSLEHKREYILDNRDLENPNVKFEVEVVIDPKSKSHKESEDVHYGRKKAVFEIDKLDLIKKQESLYFRVLSPVNAQIFKGVTFYFTIEKSLHQ